ncbi:MAG: hypothetical protein JNK56_39075, partial [Myxococcales bacterium]|nr:hypothetical protein [Myxococcales bacterium]
SRNKEKTKRLLEEKKQRQAEEARARIAKEAARVLRQAAGRFRDARASSDPEKAARLRDEGDQRLDDLEQVSADAWPWAPWMYAARETEMIIPENGGAPVYEGLRIARPRPGAPGQLDYFEFGRIVQDDEGERIGLRAAGSPGWQLIAYTGLLGGAPITAAELPRDGGPAWPEDDDARTTTALESAIRDLRYSRFESLAWRGASDVWIEKWWPRFAQPITEGLAASYHREKVPVVDDEGLAVASGAEVRGSTILPPTVAGWQRFLVLAPRSGESFTTLKEIGLAWWGRKIPWDLLSRAKETSGEKDVSPEPPTDKAGDVRQIFEKARDRVEALGLSPDKHAYYMQELKTAEGLGDGHRAEPIVEQARDAASRAEEERMGELLRRARDAEEGPPTGKVEGEGRDSTVPPSASAGPTPVLCDRCGHLADHAERHNAVAGVECPAGTTEFRQATPEEIKKYGRRDPGPPRPGTWRFQQQERQKKADERAARKLAEEAERQRKRAERESRASPRPIAHAQEILTRAGIKIDPAGLRAVGRFGECCAPNATVRDNARRALRDAGIQASIVRDRLLFPLEET